MIYLVENPEDRFSRDKAQTGTGKIVVVLEEGCDL